PPVLHRHKIPRSSSHSNRLRNWPPPLPVRREVPSHSPIPLSPPVRCPHSSGPLPGWERSDLPASSADQSWCRQPAGHTLPPLRFVLPHPHSPCSRRPSIAPALVAMAAQQTASYL